MYIYTHHIDPGPTICISPTIFPSQHHHADDDQHSEDPTPEDARDGPTDTLTSFSLEPPAPELRIGEDGHDYRVGGKGHIIEPDGRCG